MGGAKKTKQPLGRAAAIGLTKEKIVAEAIQMIDENGLNSFSIRDLGRRLKVYPAAIYWHIGGSKSDLFSEICGGVMADLMTRDEVSDDWRDTLRDLFDRYRARMHAHPHVAPMIGAQMRSNGAPNAPWVEIILDALHQGGLEGEEAIDAFNALVGGAVGFTTMELGGAPDSKEEWEQSLDEKMNALSPEEYPHLTALYPKMRNRAFVTRWKNGSEAPLDTGFRMLVDTLIEGLSARSRKPGHEG
ncbi:TetR/AcrR family transcriptional regulator [Pseudodonghicola flavimaris]|uniref:TetR/AcrR family transcriptional regulator n=1 Tax=Pseudodonghicola flavimaris TaxID=3050036 RepID=A0ABT7F0S2_9RHOB|nr:TetR/AcrR family transcriptional regulator [Pseudodonghicola flavimaris]MDK3018184.1 TetR/AcrR family transcriptional regulator [Pseudodonghicola flavimaris]